MSTNTEAPFKISVPEGKLSALRAKLDLATFPDELEDAGWAYGVPLADLKRLVARWKDGYDWRAHEKAINEELPQFTRDIEVEGHGKLHIHYVHKKSQVEGAVPLLFVHGWPGSFMEVRKILSLLTAASSNHPSFHVVALSLPGFGFSEAPKKKGFKGSEYAQVGNKLMLSLGYNQYVTQAGDWGYFVTRQIATDYGGIHSKAWHTNFPIAEPPSPFKNPLSFLQYLLTPYTPAEKAGMERTSWFQKLGHGYYEEQATQPQTIGYSLADSPVGLLAWIYEKLVNWSDEYAWDDDEGPAASLRIYYEILQPGDRGGTLSAPPTIPMGVSFFPKELFVWPKNWIYRSGNVVQTTEHLRGGHFAAHEMPEQLVGDVHQMFGKGGPAFGVVEGMDGYA